MENRSLGRGRVSVPAVGLGTWRRLEAAAAAGRHRELTGAALAAGIRLFDTSPMYGDAERLLAVALDGLRNQVIIADKVWTPSAEEGAVQLSRAVAWYGGRVDLMQIHNLVAWPARARLPGRHRPARPARGERRRRVTALVRTQRARLRPAPRHRAVTSQAAQPRPTAATAPAGRGGILTTRHTSSAACRHPDARTDPEWLSMPVRLRACRA